MALAVVLVVAVAGLANPRWAGRPGLRGCPDRCCQGWGWPGCADHPGRGARLCGADRAQADQRQGGPWPWPMWWAAGIVGVAVLETPLAIDPGRRRAAGRPARDRVLVALAMVAASARSRTCTGSPGRRDGGDRGCLARSPLLASSPPLRWGGGREPGSGCPPSPPGSALSRPCSCSSPAPCGWAGGTARCGPPAGLAALFAVSRSRSRSPAAPGSGDRRRPRSPPAAMARRRLLLLVSVVVAAVLAFVVVQANVPQLGVIDERLETLSTPTASPSDDRPGIYREAWSEIQARPLTGSGPGGFPVASSRAQSGARTIGASMPTTSCSPSRPSRASRRFCCSSASPSRSAVGGPAGDQAPAGRGPAAGTPHSSPASPRPC